MRIKKKLTALTIMDTEGHISSPLYQDHQWTAMKIVKQRSQLRFPVLYFSQIMMPVS